MTPRCTQGRKSCPLWGQSAYMAIFGTCLVKYTLLGMGYPPLLWATFARVTENFFLILNLNLPSLHLNMQMLGFLGCPPCCGACCGSMELTLAGSRAHLCPCTAGRWAFLSQPLSWLTPSYPHIPSAHEATTVFGNTYRNKQSNQNLRWWTSWYLLLLPLLALLL